MITCDEYDHQLAELNQQLREKSISFTQWLQLKLGLYRSHGRCSHYEEGRRQKLATAQMEFVL